jgi:ubiquinone/menaquinone biosynthesis C-methylase UbiE
MNGGIEGEIKRLEAQAALTFDKELFLLRALGLQEDMSILEVGSGSGSVTDRLAEEFASSRIFTVEPDPVLRDAAHRRFLSKDKMRERITALPGSCEHIPLESESVDLAFVRFVFQHLADPNLAATELLRVLKPGGRIVVIDFDGELWGLSSPYNTELMPIHARVFAAQSDRGGNRYIGRHLPKILSAAGYLQVALYPFAVSSDEVGIEAFAPIIGPENLLPHVESGLVLMSEYNSVLRDYQRFIDDPTHTVLSLGFLATGVKP